MQLAACRMSRLPECTVLCTDASAAQVPLTNVLDASQYRVGSVRLQAQPCGPAAASAAGLRYRTSMGLSSSNCKLYLTTEHDLRASTSTI